MSVYAENRKVRFDYEILETFEAGIVLKGFEVKAVKSGKISLTGSYVLPRVVSRGGAKSGNVELWLLNADIPPYQPHNTPPDYEPTHSRRLLLNKEEIRELLGKAKSSRLTLVPTKVYNKRGLVKIEIALVRSKKQHDKRDVIRKRETEREIARTLKRE